MPSSPRDITLNLLRITEAWVEEHTQKTDTKEIRKNEKNTEEDEARALLQQLFTTLTGQPPSPGGILEQGPAGWVLRFMGAGEYFAGAGPRACVHQLLWTLNSRLYTPIPCEWASRKSVFFFGGESCVFY